MNGRVPATVLNTIGPESLDEITNRVGQVLMRGRLEGDVGGSIISYGRKSKSSDEHATTKKHLKISFEPTRV